MLAHRAKNSGYLFSSSNLRDVFENQVRSMQGEVENIEANRLLNTAPADLEKYLFEKYKLDAPTLHRDDMFAEEQETKIDVRHDQHRMTFDRSRPFYLPGQRIEISIPFEGEKDLFYCCASASTSMLPKADIRGNHLVLGFEVIHDQQRDLRPLIDEQIASIEQHLQWSKKDIEGYNYSLPGQIAQAIGARRQRLLANQGRLAGLGIPLKPRPEAAETYAVPNVRRKVVPTLPTASTVPYVPEPVLDMANYEHILKVIQNMSMVMERSPSEFATMGEETLRQHFLMQLNGQFEGNATGETFNGSGKTDILLRHDGRNVFIAECKFWKGPKGFVATIDQLLGYTCWRDTKVAILVFNRGTDLTTVLAGIAGAATIHSNFKRAIEWKHESGFRYVFHHNDDKNRELILSVLVFQVPFKI